MITIRQAVSDDLEAVTSLFKNTIEKVNSQHYSAEQIKHWTSSANDLDKWQKRIEDWYFIVAERQGVIQGFAYLNNGNYFDGLFVHHQAQGLGIATKLADTIESKVLEDGFESIHSDVSITARSFFEKARPRRTMRLRRCSAGRDG